VGQPQPAQGLPSIKRAAPATTNVTTAKDLPFPAAPTAKNTIVGMVLSPQGQIIDNAIIEIRDKQAMPVRATKTNRLGQFFISTPLKNGTYEIEVESQNHTFPIQKLKLTGQIVDPLKITAKT
jgi:hypothetical protein